MPECRRPREVLRDEIGDPAGQKLPGLGPEQPGPATEALRQPASNILEYHEINLARLLHSFLRPAEVPIGQ